MNNTLRDYWERQSNRQKGLFLLAATLVLAVILVRSGSLFANLPLPQAVQKEEALRKQLLRDLKAARQEKAEFEAGKAELQRLSRRMWRGGGEAPSLARLQAELEKISRQANFPLQSVGAPRNSKLSDRVTVMEVSVRATGRMRELGHFLQELEKNDPPLEWSSCTIRPDNVKEPKLVVLEGTVRLLCLAEDAAAFLRASSQGETP